jgi:hypothetical protein
VQLADEEDRVTLDKMLLLLIQEVIFSEAFISSGNR